MILFYCFQGKPAKWRDFHSATAVGTNMYIFGGRGRFARNMCRFHFSLSDVLFIAKLMKAWRMRAAMDGSSGCKCVYKSVVNYMHVYISTWLKHLV